MQRSELMLRLLSFWSNTAIQLRFPALACSLAALLFVQNVCGADETRPDEALLQQSRESKTEVLATLEKLIKIESGTGYEPGLARLCALVSSELAGLGAKVELTPAAPSAGTNLLATFNGSGRGRILLLAHLDTVFKEGTLRDRPFRVANDRVYGPGVSDDKGGIAAGLQALRLLKRIGFRDFERITFLLNPDEEKGSFGSRQLVCDLARQHDVALVLEPGAPGDCVFNARKGIGYYKLEVTGKAAHSGVRPEEGRNAALELAHQVVQMSRLGDPVRKTTVNFTILKSGERANIIPDFAFAQADVRVFEAAEFDRLESDFRRLASQQLVPGTQVKVIADRGRPPFPPSDASTKLAEQACAIYREIGRTLKVTTSGGGSDANYAASVGTPALDGVGLVGGNDHEPTEYVEVASIEPRVYLLTRMIMECARASAAPAKKN